MTIHLGDCITVMAGMPADSVDAVVTDPPYGLEFMGKSWDHFGTNGIGFTQPGIGSRPTDWTSSTGPARVSGPNRTCATCGGRERGQRKCACGIPSWKPLGPSRGAERIGEGWASRTTHHQMSAFQAWCEAWGREALRVTKPGGYLLAFGGTRTHHRLVCGLEDAGWIIRDELDWIYASGFPKGKANLKPAHEPIVLARKPGPLRSLAIDECRIGMSETDREAARVPMCDKHGYAALGDGVGRNGEINEPHAAGRWPSNLLLSDPEVFDQPNPYVVGSGAVSIGSTPGTIYETPRYTGTYNNGEKGGGQKEFGYGDSGGYSRFFIVPKAERGDREPVLRGQLAAKDREAKYASIQDGRPHTPEGYVYDRNPRENAHPTVKPTDLMRHLVRLVTPQGGTVLDCFLGSGSTAIAAELEGFAWIGIEKEPEYVAIAEARLNGTQRGLGLDVPAPTKAPPKTHPDLAKHQPKNGTAQSTWFTIPGLAPPDEEPAA